MRALLNAILGGQTKFSKEYERRTIIKKWQYIKENLNEIGREKLMNSDTQQQIKGP